MIKHLDRTSEKTVNSNSCHLIKRFARLKFLVHALHGVL